MKITMVMVSSLNGKITRGHEADIYKWTSGEDQKFFFNLIQKSSLIIMGAGTYNAVQGKIKLDDKRLRIIMTRNTDKYKKNTVPGKLEFSAESPHDLVRNLDNKYKNALLVGGAKINELFLKANLIDKIYLTVEPFIFGQGKDLIAEAEFNKKLKLESIEKLNTKGTLLLKYKVLG